MSSPGRVLEYLIPLVQVRHHQLSMYLTCRDGERCRPGMVICMSISSASRHFMMHQADAR